MTTERSYSTVFVTSLRRFAVLTILLFLSFSVGNSQISGDTPQKPSISQVDTLYSKANSFVESDRKQAVAYAREALGMAREIDYTSGIAESATFLGYYMRYMGEPDKALEYTLEAIEAAKTLKDQTKLAFAFIRLSPIYADRGDYEKAVECGEEAVKIYEELSDTTGLGWAYNIIGESYRKSGALDRAYFYYSEAGILFESIHDKKGTGIIENNKGMVTLAKGNFERAVNSLVKSFAVGAEIGMLGLELESAEGLVRGYIGLGKFEEGKEVALPAIQKAKSEGFKPYELQLAQDLTQIYRHESNFEEALLYQERAFELQNQLLDEKVQQKLVSLDYANQIEIKEAKIKLMGEREDTQKLITFILIGSLVVFLVIATILFRISRQRNQLNSQLGNQNKKLEDLNQEKDHLMGIVAHDLKSPLNNVKMMAKLLEMTGGLSGDQKGFVGRISKSVEDGTALIQNLLDLSTLEEGKGKIEIAPLNLSKELNEAIQQNREHAKVKQIEIVQSFPGEGLGLISDGSAVRRIVDNLLSNAIKYSDKGKKVWIEASKKGKTCTFSVKDEGPGISSRDQKLLFRKFQKLSARPTAGESSSGLGLAIVKALVEELEGEIKVESTLGEGTRFSVSLPDLMH